MTTAKRDDNFIPALLGTSNADGQSPIQVYADSVTNRLLVSVTGEVVVTEMPPITVDTTGLATEAKQDAIISAISGTAGVVYKYYDDGSDATYDYLAKQGSDGSWWINRQPLAGGAVQFAVGSSDIATAWSGKDALSYSDWDTNNQPEAKFTTASETKPFLTDENGVEYQQLADTYFEGAAVTVDSAHHEIHCGDSIVLTDVTDLGNGAERNILIVTPSPVITSKRYHFYIEVISESEADYKLYEDTTTSNNGTSLSAYNRNREDPVVAENEVAFTHTPTVTGVGTLLENEHWGSGRGVGGENRGQHEWVLKNNAKYLIKVTNATTNPNQVAIKIGYYVHPGV